ncbi:hypothetical protein RI129_003270 [Pyrocoelia pectoralis]|uniref:HAT C-terminal dimerisation domain-containing protein n=1 Tax=Pyrocoelia pectoralis TaxID=417401 RepID=A0AAN7VQ22_9COLE
MLAAKRINPELNEVLSSVVKAINFIKSNALNSRLFSLLCEDMGSLHCNLLLHTEVCWLSRGCVLSRFYELKEEVCMFLNEKKPDLADKFRDGQWVAQLAFLADIFQLLNVLNLGLQGPSMTSFDLWKKIDSKESYEMFTLFSEFMSETEGLNKRHLNSLVVTYIKSVEYYFEKYFPADADVRIQSMWVVDPFLPIKDGNLSVQEREQLIDIAADTHLKLVKSQCKNISEFWVPLLQEFPQFSVKAMNLILPFHSTCEASFSTLNLIKNKQRNRLTHLDASMRMALTALKPNIDKLCSDMQDQGSH